MSIFFKAMRVEFFRQIVTLCREGVRGVAGLASATPFFRFCFIKLSKKMSQICFIYCRLHQSEIPNALPDINICTLKKRFFSEQTKLTLFHFIIFKMNFHIIPL